MTVVNYAYTVAYTLSYFPAEDIPRPLQTRGTDGNFMILKKEPKFPLRANWSAEHNVVAVSQNVKRLTVMEAAY